MKRLVAALVLVLGASFITGVVTAPQASAAHKPYRCYSHTWTYWPGSKGWPHTRWARMELKMHACARKGSVSNPGRIVKRKSYQRVAFYVNSTAGGAGYEFHHASWHRSIYANRFVEKLYTHAWWRQCFGVGSAHVCSPTGDFQLYTTFNSPYLIRHSDGSLNRWEFKWYCGDGTCGSYDDNMTMYTSP